MSEILLKFLKSILKISQDSFKPYDLQSYRILYDFNDWFMIEFNLRFMIENRQGK